jgi:hypothetical protein
MTEKIIITAPPSVILGTGETTGPIVIKTIAGGPPGISAYQTWLNLGNEGTEEDFIESLKGVPGGEDERVKYDVDDPAAGYLEEKIIAGDGIIVSEGTGIDENKLVIKGAPLNSFDYKPPAGYLYEGAVTSGTMTTMTDDTASWTVDEWKDKVIKITRNGDSDFENAVIFSNTATVLTFDDDLIFEPCALCNYKILHTYAIEDSQMDMILALDLRESECGVLLPTSTVENERKYVHVYIEKSLSDDTFIAPIICRGLDRQAGIKYGELISSSEGVRLHTHQWYQPHWDIIQTYNIKRFATGYWDADEAINSTTFVPIGVNLVYDNLRRFVPYDRDGIQWVRYRSLIEHFFMVSFIADISKAGGGVNEVEICALHRSGKTGVITLLDNRVTSTRFGAGEGKFIISGEVPVTLNRNDEVAPAIRKIGATGTFFVSAGSTLKIIQF